MAFRVRLRKLHAINAWIMLLLAVSGAMLYFPPLRALLGEGRVWLKQLHIALGLASLAVVALYLPSIGRHLAQLSKRRAQQTNLLFVLVLLAGWIGSGVVLWKVRSFPPAWSNAALFMHDCLTWIGIPYMVYHIATRTRWLSTSRHHAPPLVKLPEIRELGTYEPATGTTSLVISRRYFLKAVVGTTVAAISLPPFLHWLTSSLRDTNLNALPDAAATLPDFPQPPPLPDSLPPKGGGAAGSFRIYTVIDMPKVEKETWSLTVDGLVERPFQWNWDTFLAFPREVQVSNFHCVTGWSVYNCTWEGIPLNRLLELAGVKDGVKMVKFYSSDGVYTDAITIEQTWMEDVMVALMLDGKLIPHDLGGPVRLVVPQMYGYKSVKWLNRIEVIGEEHTGYWEQRGYAKDAWIWVPPS
ncbi:molybdopterin-dependent oxidoreductase [Paenibacillus whitsoniae]|uniref:Oxidoreductase n=1 Tax=Paenibacillus whitsoniae TaxID=2496558 RepID=A0A430JGW8_9BACL|nr:molybdopterin-dependent oxidoreductase [Paenibacillus whitsoniae]RTE10297.1 oxidoreductase [Paenibacillus whitsoniae]